MGRILLSICAVVAAVGLGGSAGSGPLAKQHTGEKQSAISQSALAGNPEPGTLGNGNEKQGKTKLEVTPLDRADLTAQQAMAVFAGIQVVLTFGGLLYIRWTLKETRKAVAEAAKATEAAQDAVGVTRESAERQLRAYLAVESFRSAVRGAPDERQVGLSVKFVNRGQTPALRVYTDYDIVFGPPGADLEAFEFPFRGGGVGVGYIPAGADHESAVTWLDRDRTVEVMEGRRSCIFYGYLDYDDVFTHTPRRRTEFCASVEIERIEGDMASVRFATVRAHNGIDEDCRRQPDPW